MLGLRAIPIAVIEYLVRSGLCRSKTEATSDVLNSIGITENTLKGWQQRLLRAAQFDLELRTIAIVAAEVKKARERVKTTPELRLCIEKNDLHFGLCALDAVRDRLKELDAHRGQPAALRRGVGKFAFCPPSPPVHHAINRMPAIKPEGGWLAMTKDNNLQSRASMRRFINWAEVKSRVSPQPEHRLGGGSTRGVSLRLYKSLSGRVAWLDHEIKYGLAPSYS